MSIANQTPAPLCINDQERSNFSIRKKKITSFCSLPETKITKFQNRTILPHPDDELIAAETNFETKLISHKDKLLEALHQQKHEETLNLLKIIRDLINLEFNNQNSEILTILDATGLLNLLNNLINPKYLVDDELMNEVFWILSYGSLYFDNYSLDLCLENGLIEKCIQIVMDSKTSDHLLLNALTFLANVFDIGVRDYLLNIKFLDHILIRNNKSKDPLKIQYMFAFFLQNFMKLEPIMNYEQIEKYIPFLIKYMTTSEDSIRKMCLSGLASICINFLDNAQLSNKFIKDFRALNGYHTLCDIVEKSVMLDPMTEGENILIKVTKILGTISLCDDSNEMNVYFLDNGITNLIFVLLGHQSSYVRKNAAWIFSNIMVCESNQISKILLNDKLIDFALYLMVHDISQDVKYNLLFAFNNSFGRISQISFTKLCNKNLIKSYIKLLNQDQTNFTFIKALLDGITFLFILNNEINEIARIGREIESLGGKKKLESLCENENEIIRQEAMIILDEYFVEVEEENTETK